MSKRRVSIRGKGAEILFGAPPAVEMQPRNSGPNSTNIESLELESSVLEPLVALQAEEDTGVPAWSPESPYLSDPDVEKALFEEARSGAPVLEDEVEAPSATDDDLPETTQMESSFVKEALAAQEPLEPLAKTPVPETEVVMEDKLTGESILDEPTSSRGSDAVMGVLPPRGDSLYAGVVDEDAASRDIQAPDEEVDWLELPERALTEEEKELMLARLGAARIRELNEQIDHMYDEVLAEVGVSEQISTECYNLLLKARDILMRHDAAKIPQAEYYIEQVRARLKRADESESGARRAQWWILAWGLFWCALFLSLVLLFNQAWFRALVAPPGDGDPLVNVAVFLSAAVWGGIGGVVAILYSLFKHVGRRDFDSQYSISYIGKPFLGLILGATVYMVLNLIIRALGIWPAGLAGTSETLAVAPGVVYLLAWACGFKENRIFDLVDRAMKRTFSGKAEPEAASGAEAEPAE
jgi:hypothetical protein